MISKVGGRRRRRGAHRLRHRPVAAPRHPRRRPRLRRRLRQSRHHRQRDAQHARPVRLSAGDRRRHAVRSSASRLVAARLGRAGGLGDLDGDLDAVPGGRPALGRAVPGRGGRPVRLGDLAAARRKRNPAVDVAALVWAALGVTGVADRGADRAGWRQARPPAGCALARAGVGLFCSAAGRRASSTSPCWRRSCRSRRSPVVARHRRDVRLDGDVVRRPLRRGAFALLWNAARPGFWAALVRRHGARALPALLVRAARRRRRHAVGPDQHRARRCRSWSAPSGWRAGAKACRAPPRRWATARPASPSSSPSRSPLELAANGSRWPMPSSSPPSRASRPDLGLHAMRRLCWPLLAVVVVRFVLNPEVLKYPLGVTPIFNWILWGYGLSIAAFVVGAALPAADRRLCAGARDRGGDRAARLRAAHPRGAQRLPPRRHGGARRAASWSARSMSWCGAPSRWPRSGWRARAAMSWPCGRGA